MRQITQDAVNAFYAKRKFNRSNTSVQIGVQTSEFTQVSMFLHDNLIATNYYDGEQGLFISNGGWSSATTKERLNGFAEVSLYQHKFIWYLNGKEWDGEMINVL